MRVAAMNIFGRRSNWLERRTVLRDGFDQLQPDLIAFQEAVVTEDYDQVHDLLGDDFHVAHLAAREFGRGGSTEDGQGLSIATRWPLTEVYQLELQVNHRTSDFACGAVAAETSAPGLAEPVLFVGYGPSWKLQLEHERALQAVATARFVEEIVAGRDMHVILAGDLNADPDSASVRFLTGRQPLEGMSVCYRDAWESIHPGEPGHTFTPENPLMSDWDWPFRRIDYILVRCGDHGGPTLQITRCDLIFNEPVDGIWASDHFGVIADLKSPKR